MHTQTIMPAHRICISAAVSSAPGRLSHGNAPAMLQQRIAHDGSVEGRAGGTHQPNRPGSAQIRDSQRHKPDACRPHVHFDWVVGPPALSIFNQLGRHVHLQEQ